MIPKRIFYVWGAGEPKRRDVWLCIESWRRVMPDWEIIELNEADSRFFDYAKELKENRWFETVYRRKLWAYVADYVRVKTLHDHGGLYLDTDVSLLQSLEVFGDEPAFTGIHFNGPETGRNLTEPAVLGAEKRNPFLAKALAFYDKEVWNAPVFMIPHVFELVLRREYHVCDFPAVAEQTILRTGDLTLLPQKILFPFRYGETFTPSCVLPETRSVHWFQASWNEYENLYWLQRKHERAETEIDRDLELARQWTWGLGMIRTALPPPVMMTFLGLPFLRGKSVGPTRIKLRLFGFLPVGTFRKSKAIEHYVIQNTNATHLYTHQWR